MGTIKSCRSEAARMPRSDRGREMDGGATSAIFPERKEVVRLRFLDEDSLCLSQAREEVA